MGDLSNSSMTEDILKIQEKLSTFEIGSRNYKKYEKILKKHIKTNNIKNRNKSHHMTLEVINEEFD